MSRSRSVTVIGAGIAGLACAADLSRAGIPVLLLEGRDRIGGRIWTLHPPQLEVPVELGAEFIHGSPPQIIARMRREGREIIEVAGQDWCAEDGRLCDCDLFEPVYELLMRMKHVRSDVSFTKFLQSVPSSEADERVRRRALDYVSGFNAADPGEISVHSLVEDMEAQEQIGGDRSYRIRGGYDALVSSIHRECLAAGVEIRLGHVVNRIEWSSDVVRVGGSSGGSPFTIEAPRLVITVPASVLQADSGESAITFDPGLPFAKTVALAGIRVGPVIRVTLVFRERFWGALQGRNGRSLASMRFLFSHDECFPTWWTTQPIESPVLVGWAAAKRADRFIGKSKDFVVSEALESLSGIFKVGRAELEQLLHSAHICDWQTDTFARGAYSYLRAGSANASDILAQPIEKRLYFAGEATSHHGNHGTVHGALISGERVASEILRN